MPRAAPLHVQVERQGTLPIVHVLGEVDICTVGQAEGPLRRELAGSPNALVLNLLDVTFMDVSGMRMLVEAQVAARRTDTDLRLALPRVVLRPLRVLGLTDRFATYGSVEDAVAA